ncbi:phage holin family protein [Roseicyclus mahoneyensis]|uniref:Putative superfamily III holin-X n=1 Tax=Roseicyclus mahoneyensis TaxID=164332 RepID=A0A316H275_9RHOB|nr:phage holin family protein [Roseicyclus mahoneyensis]PWK61461.1 putative superfamily III holin-X [Roseicyclus mahoneyensis]
MSATDTPKSASAMMSDLMGHVGNLVRNEVDLARAEIAQSLGKVGASLGAMALAVAIGIAGLNLVATSLVALAVWAGLPPRWATLVVGAVLIVVALLIFRSARSSLHQIGFAPTRTARNVQRDAAALKDSFNDK